MTDLMKLAEAYAWHSVHGAATNGESVIGARDALQEAIEALIAERDAWMGNYQETSHLCLNTIFERDQLRIKIEGEAVAVKLWCETCEGKGTVDNTLGGDNPNSTDHDSCPDCDGSGGFVSSVYRNHPAPEAPVVEQIQSLQEQIALLEGTLESRERNISELQAENERLKDQIDGFVNGQNQLFDAAKVLEAERDALQAECAEHKENAMRNARQAVAFRAERDQLQAQLDAMGKGEAVAYIQTQKGGEVELVWDKDEELDGALYEYAPLYAEPKALAPLTQQQRMGVWNVVKTEGDGKWEFSFSDVVNAVEAAHGIQKGGQ